MAFPLISLPLLLIMALWLAIEDLRFQEVPAWLLVSFMGVIILVTNESFSDLPYKLLRGISLTVFIYIIKFYLEVKRNETCLGIADLALFFCAGTILPFDQWPLFFIFSGTSTLMISLYLKKFSLKERIPFIPSLIISLLLCYNCC